MNINKFKSGESITISLICENKVNGVLTKEDMLSAWTTR